MKKRYLKPVVEKVLTITAIILGVLAFSVDTVGKGGFAPTLALLVLWILNLKVLKKYGRNLLTEK